MSEEEIIKNINKTLEIINSRAFYEYVGDGSVYMTAITDLLDLYKKEKEKNKGLEIRASELNGFAEVVERDYIHKDKIKEKYLEMEQEYAKKVYDNNYNRTEVKKEEMYKRQVYEKLLEGK